MAAKVQLIVGLGNPGPQYAKTRHNVGVWFIQELAIWAKETLRAEPKFKSITGDFSYNEHKCRLLFPLTYMNNSGEAVQACSTFYKIPPEAILVVHDELDFAPGIIRLKFNGGAGGHKGLQSIIAHLHSEQFYRLRIGIGHPGNKNAVLNYVLNKPAKAEQQLILDAIAAGLTIIPELLAGRFDKAVQILHG